MKIYLLIILVFISGVGCSNSVTDSSQTEPSTSEDFVPVSGGTMTGALRIPEDGLAVGDSQWVMDSGNIGVGTDSPTSVFTVNGMIESLVDGIKFPDGSVQTSAAGTSCFGGVCTGDTEFSGKIEMTSAPSGAGAQDASLVVNASSANANESLLTVSLAGAQRMSLDAEGDLTLIGDFNLSGDLTCTECISSSASILDGVIELSDLAADSVDASKIKDGAISADDLADNSVTEVKLIAGANEETLTTNASGNTEWLPAQIQYGLKFEFVSTSSLQFIPTGINSKASVLVSNGTDLRSVVLSANLVADITVSGVGGLDTGAEAINTGYDVRIITEAEGANPGLLLTVSGAAPTLPGAYEFSSEVLWFVSNSQGGGGDFAEFVDLGDGKCQYLISGGINVLDDGENTAVTAIDFSSVVPDSASIANVLLSIENDTVTLTDLNLFLDSTATTAFHAIENLANTLLTGNRPVKTQNLDVIFHNGVSNSLFYAFTAAPAVKTNFGVTVGVFRWQLPSRMSR